MSDFYPEHLGSSDFTSDAPEVSAPFTSRYDDPPHHIGEIGIDDARLYAKAALEKNLNYDLTPLDTVQAGTATPSSFDLTVYGGATRIGELNQEYKALKEEREAALKRFFS